MITVEHITKKFVRNKNKKEKEVFFADNDITFEANDGEIIGILGPNGAGKTTLLRMIAGILEPTEGSINFDNLNGVTRIITSGTRAYDIAIRIKTSGFDSNKIEPYLNLHDAVQSLYKTNVKKYVIANYTALQPTRKELKL